MSINTGWRTTENLHNVEAVVNSKGYVIVEAGDGAGKDAFARMRVSEPVTLFDSSFQYDKQPLIWGEKLVTGGTATHQPTHSAITLAVTADINSRAVYQTRKYFRYQPGKSQLIFMTGTFGTTRTGVAKRTGYFDDNDGIYIENYGGNISIVQRSSVSGAVVNTEVASADWNVDTGADIDWEKGQILIIDLEWLSLGRVRVGVVLDGQIRYLHHFNNAGAVSVPYMATANLPGRYEIVNVDGAAGTDSYLIICATVMSEGGVTEGLGIPFTASNGTTLKSVTSAAYVPLVSIRPAATFNSIVNRAELITRAAMAYASAQPVLMQLVYNPTLTGATFATAGASSSAEKDVAATALTGGIVIAEVYIPAASSNPSRPSPSAISVNLASKLPLTLDIDGANPIVLTLAAIAIDTTTTVGGIIEWQENK